MRVLERGRIRARRGRAGYVYSPGLSMTEVSNGFDAVRRRRCSRALFRPAQREYPGGPWEKLLLERACEPGWEGATGRRGAFVGLARYDGRARGWQRRRTGAGGVVVWIVSKALGVGDVLAVEKSRQRREPAGLFLGLCHYFTAEPVLPMANPAKLPTGARA